MIEPSLVVAAASLGVLGSAHCAGMCGPLAIGACARGGHVSRTASLSYLGGRGVAYAMAGTVVGAMGRHALCRLPVRTIEVVAAISVGLFALARGVERLRAYRVSTSSGERLVALGRKPRARSSGSLAFLVKLLPSSSLGLGLATPLLPCGMLLSALAIAASTASPIAGALAMVTFSFASLPGLVVALLARGVLGARAFSPRVVGAAWCVLGLVMLVRPWLVSAHCAMR
jgi:sulfite exporter TauE/SafE